MTTTVRPSAQSVRETRESPPARFAAVVLACFLGAYAVYQLTLAAGAPFARAAWGGTRATLPGNLRVGSVLTIFVFIAFAVVVLRRVGFRVRWISRTVALRGSWVVTVILALSALVNLASSSSWERYLNGPLTLLAAGLCFFVANRGGPLD